MFYKRGLLKSHVFSTAREIELPGNLFKQLQCKFFKAFSMLLIFIGFLLQIIHRDFSVLRVAKLVLLVASLKTVWFCRILSSELLNFFSFFLLYFVKLSAFLK